MPHMEVMREHLLHAERQIKDKRGTSIRSGKTIAAKQQLGKRGLSIYSFLPEIWSHPEGLCCM